MPSMPSCVAFLDVFLPSMLPSMSCSCRPGASREDGGTEGFGQWGMKAGRAGFLVLRSWLFLVVRVSGYGRSDVGRGLRRSKYPASFASFGLRPNLYRLRPLPSLIARRPQLLVRNVRSQVPGLAGVCVWLDAKK
jgi:hypothetical protein